MIKKARRHVIPGILALMMVFLLGVPSPFGVDHLPVSHYSVAPSGGEPAVCIGYSQLRQDWGYDYGNCPAHYAYYGVDDPAGVAYPPDRIQAVMNCCPLPSKDILTDQHTFVLEECPPDHIATGSLRVGEQYYMRCTQVNTERYQLGDQTEGWYWGDGAAGWQDSRRIEWENIPAAIRYSHGRVEKLRWDVDGCVGYPWGSLLTMKKSKYCSGFTFRQLQFAGMAGDPSAGTPVKMFPDCDEVININEPSQVKCINKTSAKASAESGR